MAAAEGAPTRVTALTLRLLFFCVPRAYVLSSKGKEGWTVMQT